MHFAERVWTAAVHLLNVLTLSPFKDNGLTVQDPAGFTPSNVADSNFADFPSFRPPGAPKKDIVCKYPKMVGWEDCSTEENRGCWLRQTSTGKEYNISTDYDKDAPIGILREYWLTLDPGKVDADGMVFDQATLFNNSYPGPWIEACWGDTVKIHVTNKLPHNGTSVHWHGLRQINSAHMDGVNGVTQCPISPYDYFVYQFKITQYGSSWYHSHYSVQYADGAVGPMTLHGPSSAPYDEAISPPLIMTDWGHTTAFQTVHNSNFNYFDILLNGRGSIKRFHDKNNETEILPPYHITVQKPVQGKRPKRYLLRLINTSFASTFLFSIDNHLLTVVTADFVPIHPFSKTSILIGIGQRYNVIVEANPISNSTSGPIMEDGNYWMRTYLANCRDKPKDAKPGYEKNGILRYNPDSTALPKSVNWTISDEDLACSDEKAENLRPVVPWTVALPINEDRQAREYDMWRNNTPPAEPNTFPLAHWTLDPAKDQLNTLRPIRVDYSDPYFLNLNKTKEWIPPAMWRVVNANFTESDWFYIVIKGLGGGSWGAHPMHLHGHDFAILEQAYNKTFDASTLNLNLKNPPRRDVVLMPLGGYVVIAFKLDNPGPWLMHCHIAFHISEGLGLQINERHDAALKMWPDNSDAILETRRVCDNWKAWQGNSKNWDPLVRPDVCSHKNHPEWCFQDDSGV